MEDVNKCPLCENTIQKSDEGFTCPECSTEFSKVGESAYLINHVGNFSVSELLDAVQHMVGSHLSFLDI